MKLYEIIAHIEELPTNKLRLLKDVIDVIMADKMVESDSKWDMVISPLGETTVYEKPENL